MTRLLVFFHSLASINPLLAVYSNSIIQYSIFVIVALSICYYHENMCLQKSDLALLMIN